MRESCYCSRTGDIRDRLPVLDGDGKRALECSDCGHADYLSWLPEETSLLLWDEAKRRREIPLTWRDAPLLNLSTEHGEGGQAADNQTSNSGQSNSTEKETRP